jgi:hypothetical protein
MTFLKEDYLKSGPNYFVAFTKALDIMTEIVVDLS